ncbi:hypothetical protein B9J90_08935 [Vibrio sp. V09_P4A23P171]|uniref:hypothetical protein n=1 Tax=unclassified Vibrio TaxID=2614977 RepID=UPI000B8E8EBA|nr:MULTISPECIES: hypothetical protein [unclassified Vibrio]EKO3478441.1 hypothetical protein [Vibrio fluvialis]ELI5734810.1 hypothetical protein [Vibrio fluvialis]OXX36239.1 hypothetical protein B9J90_08935 [Vibrio sp. V09_P4A23P171]OXX73617.1 hypothetical protein B9J87_05490 [Vibrio sp. V19_P1S1T109]
MTSEDILHIIQDEMGEKAIASVTLTDAGNLIVQYGDKVVVYKTPTSAKPASELLKIVADFIN